MTEFRTEQTYTNCNEQFIDTFTSLPELGIEFKASPSN